jgi:hypothetical protein
MPVRIRTLLYLATAFFVSGASLLQSGARATQADAGPADGRPAVTLTAEGVTLDWRTPPVQIDVQADGAARVTLPGYPAQGEPGAPLLPASVALVALPPGAAPTLQVLQVEEQALPLPGPIALAPVPTTDGLGQPLASPPVVTTESVSEPVRLDDLGVVRGARLAHVVFFPARPEGGLLRLTTHLRVAVDYHAPALALSAAESAAAAKDPVLASLQAAVVNPGQVAPLPARAAPARLNPGANTTIAAIDVITPGITAITYQTLQTAGFTVSNPSHLHLIRRTGAFTQEVALQWDNSVQTFSPGDRLLFYAAPRFSRWTNADTYFLSEDATPGLRMQPGSAPPGGLPVGVPTELRTAEVNTLYMPSCFCGYLPPGRDGDHWAWDELTRTVVGNGAVGHTSGTYALSLPAVDATQPATLTVWLVGETDVLTTTLDHRVSIALNSSAVLTSTEWNGKQAITLTVPVPAGVVIDGMNSLRLNLPGIKNISVEGTWLDAFSITYARRSAAVSRLADTFLGQPTQHAYTVGLASTSGVRAYDITDEAQPAVLTGTITTTTSLTLGDPASGLPRRYAVAAEGGILSPARVRLVAPLQASPGADYLIITHPDFEPALASLVALRALSYTVAVENVQAIYDAHDGRPDPEAIRAYIRNAFTTWSPRPAFVLLVGDGTLDPKHYLSASSDTFIPPYLADADLGGGETAADNRYVVTADPIPVPAWPDMWIGRLPVNTLAEAQTVVDKIVRYEAQPWVGDWNSRATAVTGISTTGEDFAAQSDRVMQSGLPVSITRQRIYYYQGVSSKTGTQQAIRQSWNNGASLIMFTGHASWHQWDFDRLFHSDDVAGLTNGGWLPVGLEMTCFTGSFQIPNSETLDEALVRHAGGGAVAVWGATGLGLSSGHENLADGFLSTIYQAGQTLGDAAWAGKRSLVGSYDLVDTYTLLGDPATRLNTTVRPWPVHVYVPAMQR